MSQKNALIDAVGFEFLLLDSYKQLGLKEDEVIVCLMIDHLSEQGNSFIDANILSLKMNLSMKEIDNAMSSLITKGYLVYGHDQDEKLITSLEPLKEKIKKEFAFSLLQEQNDSYNKEKEDIKARLLSLFEERFSRTLTPLEINTIKEWLDNGYTEDNIRNALLDALNGKKKTIRAVNKILVSRRKQDDIQKEGASAVNDRWDKSVEETIQAARSLWGNPEDDN